MCRLNSVSSVKGVYLEVAVRTPSVGSMVNMTMRFPRQDQLEEKCKSHQDQMDMLSPFGPGCKVDQRTVESFWGEGPPTRTNVHIPPLVFQLIVFAFSR